MLGTAVLAVALAAGVGLAIKLLLPRLVRNQIVRDDRRITRLEYALALVVVITVVTPSVLAVGNKLSINNILRYEEMYNGVETIVAQNKPRVCHAGQAGSSKSSGYSNCRWAYDTGQTYTWQERHETCTTDSKNQRRCTVWYSTERGNIYAPYATHEYTYRVEDSLGGKYDYPGVYLAKDPVPYYKNRPIPNNVPKGPPADWLEAKARRDAGNPRPVTRMFGYDNYILASQDEMLVPVKNGDIGRYRNGKLLPDHTANILDKPIYGTSRPLAKKVSFVGVTVSNEDIWQDALMRFNAPLGSKLRGDLHVVVIDSSLVDNPDRYAKALRAYWLSKHFGKRALSKNGIMLVIGTRNGTVEWAKADTGMPFGNNVMLRTMEGNLQGKALNPDVIFGNPKTVIIPATKKDADDEVIVTLSQPRGVLEEAMFEIAPYEHPCMTCDKERDAGKVGYKGLIDKIEPTGGQKSLMVLVVVLLSLPFWWAVAATSFLERGREYVASPVRTRRREFSHINWR